MALFTEVLYLYWSHSCATTSTLYTTQSNLLHDYDSVAVCSESIKSARLSACRIDGSYELLGGEESNIGGPKTEDLQQKWPMTAVLGYKTDIHMIYKVKGGPWRKAKVYAIRPDKSSPLFWQNLATLKVFSHTNSLPFALKDIFLRCCHNSIRACSLSLTVRPKQTASCSHSVSQRLHVH